MDFTAYCREELCHPDAVHEHRGEKLHCSVCGQTFDAFAYITRSWDHDLFHSCRLAEAFARQFRHLDVPCWVTLVDLPGVLPTQFLTRFRTLHNAVHLLRHLNAPFRPPAPPGPRPYIIDHFMEAFMKVIQQCYAGPSTQPEEQMVLTYVLENMRRIVAAKVDVLHYYEENLVPFVKVCRGEWLLPPSLQEGTLALQWLYELRASASIQAYYGIVANSLEQLLS